MNMGGEGLAKHWKQGGGKPLLVFGLCPAQKPHKVIFISMSFSRNITSKRSNPTSCTAQNHHPSTLHLNYTLNPLEVKEKSGRKKAALFLFCSQARRGQRHHRRGARGRGPRARGQARRRERRERHPG